MKRGDRVLLEAYGNERIWRRVVGTGPRRVFVCSDDDFGSHEERAIGFLLGDVLDIQEAGG